jgi:signal transduction histidine kinase
MKMKRLKFGRHSVFIKLLIVLIITGVIINVMVTAFFGLQLHAPLRTILYTNISHYFSYLAQEIGSPPDTAKAEKLAEGYSIRITYQSDQFQWTSANKIVPDNKNLRNFHTPRLGIKWFFHQEFPIPNPDGSQFIFELDYAKLFARHGRHLIGLIAILTLVLTISYLISRHILKPIKLLQQGVEQISSGDLNHKIAIRNKDELGDLTQSFNEMTTRIKEMLSARDQLLLDVSHELRSPLTRIRVALEFLPDGKNKQSIQEDLIEIETMITEILETERLKESYGKIKLESQNIIEIIKSVSTLYKDQSPGIILKSLPKELFLMVNAERIKMVFKNIIENAVKYSTVKSQPIEISIERATHVGSASHISDFVDEENKTIVLIKDDGSGIPEEHLPYLFEPFYRVDKSRSKKTGGYGLGLSLCKKIMAAHGGSIEICNNPDRGATVRLVFTKRP